MPDQFANLFLQAAAGGSAQVNGKFADMTLMKGVKYAINEETKQVLYELARRVQSIKPQQDRLIEWANRADLLYFAERYTRGGADLWPDDPSATEPGRSHLSVNLPATYVDVPAALQAVEPIENMLATDTTPEARAAAAAIERLYTAWKQSDDFELKFHKAITVKGLYGLVAGRVYWDPKAEEGKGKVCMEVVEQPRNLWIGYKNDSYAEVEWAAYVMRYEPNALSEQFGVDVLSILDEDSGQNLPFVAARDWNNLPNREWLTMGDARVEVWDYWYRKPVWSPNGTFLRMETWNCVIAGNAVIRGPLKYPEYSGEIPYLPLFNTFVPGIPQGRPDLYDMEHLIREQMELTTAGSQMIYNGVAGDFWQLTGPEAPWRIPAGLKPKRNEIVGPGPGNRIETITPFIATFQLEQHLGRIDRWAAEVSGLNDLLLGLAPAQVLSSSKAINALIANYESRLSIRRKLLYKWRRNIWELVVKVWAKKDKTVKTIVGAGAGFLDIQDPSLSPRDEQDTAMRATQLMQAKVISQARAMDMVGVDDPETEQDLIREESTDATLWPERVQIMAQLLSVLQSLGLQTPAGAQEQAQGQMTRGQADLRKALGEQTPTVDQGAGGPGAEPPPVPPPVPGLPPEAGGPPVPFAQGPAGNTESPVLMQGMIQGGKAKSRIMTQTKLGRR